MGIGPDKTQPFIACLLPAIAHNDPPARVLFAPTRSSARHLGVVDACYGEKFARSEKEKNLYPRPTIDAALRALARCATPADRRNVDTDDHRRLPRRNSMVILRRRFSKPSAKRHFDVWWNSMPLKSRPRFSA